MISNISADSFAVGQQTIPRSAFVNLPRAILEGIVGPFLWPEDYMQVSRTCRRMFMVFNPSDTHTADRWKVVFQRRFPNLHTRMESWMREYRLPIPAHRIWLRAHQVLQTPHLELEPLRCGYLARELAAHALTALRDGGFAMTTRDDTRSPLWWHITLWSASDPPTAAPPRGRLLDHSTEAISQVLELRDRRLVTLTRERVYIWDPGLRIPLRRLAFRAMEAVEIPGERLVLSRSSYGPLSLLSLNTGTFASIEGSEGDGAIAKLPDGRIASAGESGDVRIWSLPDPLPVVLKGHTESVWTLQVLDEHHLISASRNEGTIRIWNTSNVKEEPRVLHGFERCLVVLPHHGLAAVTSTFRVRVWSLLGDSPIDLEVPRSRSVSPHDPYYIHSLVALPDGTLAASTISELVTWSLPSGQSRIYPFANSLLTVLSDGRLIYVDRNDGTIRVLQYDPQCIVSRAVILDGRMNRIRFREPAPLPVPVPAPPTASHKGIRWRWVILAGIISLVVSVAISQYAKNSR